MRIELTTAESKFLGQLLLSAQRQLESTGDSDIAETDRGQAILLAMAKDLLERIDKAQASECVCIHCGKSFVVTGDHGTTRFCSKTCSRRFERLSDRAIQHFSADGHSSGTVGLPSALSTMPQSLISLHSQHSPELFSSPTANPFCP